MRLPTSEDTPLNSAIAMFSASPFATGAISLLGSVAAYGLYKILAFIYAEFTSPLRNFPGPPSPSFVFGNFKQMRESMVSYGQTLIVLIGPSLPSQIGYACSSRKMD